MAVPVYTVACKENKVIARDVYEVHFEKPEGFTFKPGQFVLFDVALIDNPTDIQTRAFSLASVTREDTLLFAAKMTPGGRASRWIAEVLKPGMQATVKGPFGFFTLDPKSEKELVFIATSTGVGPFRSQIITALENGDKRRMDLVYGVRSEEDLFWEEELKSLTQKYDNFYLHLALSNGSEAWTGHRGRVQTLVPQIVKDFSNKNVYVCGSPNMTRDLKQLCLETWGIQKPDLHVEGYI